MNRPHQRRVKHGPRGSLAWVVRAPQSSGSRHLGRLILGDRSLPCALGRSGITGRKREGDGATPRAKLSLIAGRYRADRVGRPVASRLGHVASWSFWKRIDAHDGWCDAPFTPVYNRQVRTPHPQSHEEMRRADHLYDRMIILDWNITSRAQGRGSAIFLHQAREERSEDGTRTLKPTEGCIALKADDWRRLAPHLVRLRAIDVL